MLQFLFAMIAIGAQTASPQPSGTVAMQTPADAVSTQVAVAPAQEATPDASGQTAALAPPAAVEEAPAALRHGAVQQVATGRFTTALEVRPILTATRSSWVALREFNGDGLVYVTQIWSWRCGLAAMAIGLNDEPLQDWPLPPCHEDQATPNAILDGDGQPYLTLQPGSVERVVIELTYDDMTTDRAEYQRADVLMR